MKNTFLGTLFILFGIACTTYSQDRYTFLGPSGCPGGKPFNDQPLLPDESKVIEVRIRHAKFIDAIQFVHKTKLGRVELNKHGGSGGKEDVFYLQPGEYITEITCKSGKYVDSLN